MLAWLCTTSLLLAAQDGSVQPIELPPVVRAAVAADLPESLLRRLAALGTTGVTAAWSVELGLARDPAARLDDGAPKVWSELLDGAAIDSLLLSLDAALPEDAPYTALQQAFERLGQRHRPQVVPVMAGLLQRLPASSLQSGRTTAWVRAALIDFAAGHPELRAALDRHYERFPAAAWASVDLALLSAGSSAPLNAWGDGTMGGRELADRLHGLKELPRGFPTTNDVLVVLAKLLKHEDPLVRTRAVQGVSSMGATGLIPELVGLVSDPDRRVVRAAGAALGELGRVSWPRSEADWRSWWSAEQDWSRTALPALLDDLTSADRARRVRSLRLLLEHPAAAHDSAPAMGEAVSLTADETFCLRLVGSIAALRGPASFEALRSAAGDGRASIRSAALAGMRN